METPLAPSQVKKPYTKKPLHRRLTALAIALVMMLGISLAAATPSQAATATCGNGRCTVYLSWNETVALSQGKVPTVANAGNYVAPIRAGLIGHIWIAKGWVNRGNCVAFTFDIRPWANQGMMGWRCR